MHYMFAKCGLLEKLKKKQLLVFEMAALGKIFGNLIMDKMKAYKGPQLDRHDCAKSVLETTQMAWACTPYG